MASDNRAWRGNTPEDRLKLLPRELPDSTGPGYLRLANLLADAIATGTLGQGNRLPRTRALGSRYDMSATTVQAAITHLVDRGIVGKGPSGRAYVARKP